MSLPAKYLFLPEYWFFGIDSLFELIFFIITALVCWYGYKAYKLTKKQAPQDFFTGFALISLSFLVKSITNFILHFQINKGNLSQEITASTQLVFAWGYYIHLLLMLAGLVFLAFTALKEHNRRTRYLIGALVLALSLQSQAKVGNYYVSAIILLSVVVYHYLKAYLATRSKPTLLVLCGFTCLLGAQWLFYLIEHHILYYVTGHLLELAGYTLLLFNLLACLWFSKKWTYGLKETWAIASHPRHSLRH